MESAAALSLHDSGPGVQDLPDPLLSAVLAAAGRQYG